MPDFLHQRYVVVLYTHLRGGRLKGGWSFPKVFGALLFSEKVSGKIQGALPSRELTYPTWGKGKSSSKVPLEWDMLVPWRVNYLFGREIKQCKGTINFRDFPLRVHLARVGVVQ